MPGFNPTTPTPSTHHKKTQPSIKKEKQVGTVDANAERELRLEQIILKLNARRKTIQNSKNKKDSHKVGQHASTIPTQSSSMSLKKPKPANKRKSKKTRRVKRPSRIITSSSDSDCSVELFDFARLTLGKNDIENGSLPSGIPEGRKVEHGKERNVDTNGGQNEILNFGHATLEGSMTEETRKEGRIVNSSSDSDSSGDFFGFPTPTNSPSPRSCLQNSNIENNSLPSGIPEGRKMKLPKEQKVDANEGQNEILNFGHATLEGSMTEKTRNESNSYEMDSKTSAFNMFLEIYPKLSSTYVNREFNESEIRKTNFHVYLRILKFIASQSDSKDETLDTSIQTSQKNVMSSLEEEILPPSQYTTADPKGANETETNKELWSFIFGDAEATSSKDRSIEDQIQNLAHSEAASDEAVFFDFVGFEWKALQSFFQTHPTERQMFRNVMEIANKCAYLGFQHQLTEHKLNHIAKAKVLLPDGNFTTRQENCTSNIFPRPSAGTTREPKPAVAGTSGVAYKIPTKQSSPTLNRIHATSIETQKLKHHNRKRCHESLSNDSMKAQQNKFHDNTSCRDKLTEISSQLKSQAKKHRKKNKTKANVELLKLASQAKETGSVPDSRGLQGQRKYMKKSRMTGKSLKDGFEESNTD